MFRRNHPAKNPETQFRQFSDNVAYTDAVDKLKHQLSTAQDLVSNWAIQGVQEAMVKGERKGLPYAEMNREEKLALLTSSVNWNRYTELGMDEKTPLVIMFNAIDGKPPEKWLEQSPQEAASRKREMNHYLRKSFEQELSEYAALSPAKGRDLDLDR